MSEPESGIVSPSDPAHAQRAGDWDDLRHTLRHRAKEAIDLISILVQDAVILLAG